MVVDLEMANKILLKVNLDNFLFLIYVRAFNLENNYC